MQTTDRQATVLETKQPAEHQARKPQPIDAALLRLIGGGLGEPPTGTDPYQLPKGGW